MTCCHPEEVCAMPIYKEPMITKNRMQIKQDCCKYMTLNGLHDERAAFGDIDMIRSSKNMQDAVYMTHSHNMSQRNPHIENYNVYGRIIF